ncbi:MAG: LCP family protein [Candidatus Daviesbacteria bacterium]|nr:LCP family protein [Candidatus Daviesbacteria bacterium]
MRGIIKIALLIFILIGFGLFVLWWQSSSSSTAFNFVFGKESALKVESGRVNILLLGIAGAGHDGPNLTDTIMVASYKPSTAQVDLISLPRDLWIDEHKAKINTLYQLGLNKKDGLGFVQGEIGKILGIDIPYAIRVDFNGFIKAVDLLGGIDVDVQQSFDDYFYPVPGKENELCDYQEKEIDIDEAKAKELNLTSGKVKALVDSAGKIATASATAIIYSDAQVFKLFSCRFEHLSFTKGVTSMDGETALKFVRSRHGSGKEGSDFARSARQELVLKAFKNQVLSVQNLLNPQKIVELLQTFGSNVETNIPVKLYPEFIKILKQQKDIKSFVIDSTGKDPFLIVPPSGDYGAWILIPPNNDFGRIQKHIDNIFSGILEASVSATPTS